MKRRAESQEQTRNRIVEAMVALHEELGPRATTVSAIAERAGVQRLTVYRHFPDEDAMLEACTGHWIAHHPPPAPSDWAGPNDPAERLARALEAHYRYYTATQGMWSVGFREAPDVPGLRKPMAEFVSHLGAIAADLAAAFGKRENAKALTATIGHALAFSTWNDLEARGLDDAGKRDLALSWVRGTLDSPPA